MQNPTADTIDHVSTQPLQCMELWGGNRAIEKAIGTPGLDIWISSVPYEGAVAGGDVHYVSLCGGGQITRIMLADVSGHGIVVDEIAKSLRDMMRTNINQKDQSKLVKSLNQEFNALAQLSRFATAIVATYLTKGDTLAISNAGHPRPFWWRAETGTWSVIHHDYASDAGLSNLPLGFVEEATYTQSIITLSRDDLLLFYTDALTESEGPGGKMLGESGLLDLLTQLDATRPAALPAALAAALDAHRGGHSAGDDATFILLHHTAAPTRRPGLFESMNVYAKVLGIKSV
jgi:phosphoserine phosphatase RsbU/P